ncbi:VOC family protein [Roseovarius sp. 2305UL8-3]|uniref:VOC family protein n=1 Tax=Roseovarius conchicola TaxID=3121636 RepID=UPI003527EA4B
MPTTLSALDHLVLTVRDLDKTLSFYTDVLGMTPISFGEDAARWALGFGAQKINLHVAGAEFEPKAECPAPGSGDLCFLSTTALTEWQTHLERLGITILDGPVPRTGATGPLMSLYIRDPDGNLIEISNPV